MHGTGEPGSAEVGLTSPQAALSSETTVWGVPLNDDDDTCVCFAACRAI